MSPDQRSQSPAGPDRDGTGQESAEQQSPDQTGPDQAGPGQAGTDQAESRTAPAPARRRAPRKDEVLVAAVDAAREALAGLATPEQIGEHVGVAMDDDRLATHRFVSLLPGYRGWHWYATIARVPRSRHVTVCEAGLVAGQDSLVAPPWVPYAERVSEDERARLRAVAEGRDPGRQAPAEADADAASAPAEAEADEATTGEAQPS